MKNLPILSFLLTMACLTGQAQMTGESIKKSLNAKHALSEFDQVDNIMQFNKDTILVSGYLADNTTRNRIQNIVYQTFNRGKRWNVRHFNGDAWIYNAHFEKDGKVWMGGSDEVIHYSADYGTSWVTKPKPFQPANRVLSIYMTDSLNGIAGGLHNGLAITHDNWATAMQVPTPLDQKKFRISENSSRDRVEKVQMADSLVLINQNDHIYFSKLNPVEWKVFNVPVTDFSVNKTEKTISLTGLQDKVYLLDSRLNLIRVYTDRKDGFASGWPANDNINFSGFLNPGIKLVKIRGVRYDFDRMEYSCMPIALYKEKAEELKVKDPGKVSRLKDIVAGTRNFSRPLAESFTFSKEDMDDYTAFYKKVTEKRQDEKLWGGDFTSLLDIGDDHFKNPGNIINSPDQSILDTVYNSQAARLFFQGGHEPYLVITIVNNNLDTLSISSKNAGLFSLPWTIELGRKTFTTFDTRITAFLRAVLPGNFNYYGKLFAGELIYNLVEQKVFNELEYKNAY